MAAQRCDVLARDAVSLGLTVLCVYLWQSGRGRPQELPCPPPQSCAPCDCAAAACNCPSCPPATPEASGCAQCADCSDLSNNTARLLSTLDTMPQGLLTPTRPTVYVLTDHPTLVHFSLQTELPAYELLAGIARAPSAPPGVVVDVGGGYGTFALFAARLGRRALAVEPSAALLRSIQASARINGVSDLVSTEGAFVLEGNTAVKDSTGRVSKALPVDAVVARVGKVLMLRVDTRGYEGLVIRSAVKALQERKVEHLVAHFRDTPESVAAHSQLGKRADTRGVLQVLARDGWRGRLLRSPCSERMREKLEPDFGVRRRFGVDAWHLGGAQVEGFLAALRHKALRGASCPVWFSRT